MKKISLAVLGALAINSTVVSAEETLSGFDVTGFLTGTNNFMYRGLSLSDNSVAVQGQFSLTHTSGFYATLWASNTRLQAPETRGNNPNMEGNFLIGYTGKITDDLGYDIGYLRTFYPGGSSRFDFSDYYATLMFKGISAGLSYSDDFFAETGPALYSFVAYDNKIINDVSLHAKVGYTRNDSRDFLGIFGVDKSGWAHYELGLSHPLPKDFKISGIYHWTTGDVKEGFDIPGFGTNRFQINLTKSF